MKIRILFSFATLLLFTEVTKAQTAELQATSKVIVNDGYDHAELAVTPWGGSHGLFFGSRIQYSGSGDLWHNNNAVYASGAGPYSYGAFSMGYVANGGLFGFWDGGLSTGPGNAISWSPVMALVRGGSVGIGTINPRGVFDVAKGGDVYLSETPNGGTTNSVFLSGHVYLAPYENSDVSYLQARRKDNSGTSSLRLRTVNAGTLVDAMHIAGNGNVGIGTIDPQAKLAVNGDIVSKKVKVTQTGWADYVFEPTYQLPSLQEVEAFIKTNKHLPDVPSSKEVETNGLDVGENQAVLLKKIEEQMLYILELNKSQEALLKKVNEMEQEIKRLRNQ